MLDLYYILNHHQPRAERTHAMRTLKEIAARTKQLDPSHRRWHARLNILPMKKGNAAINPLNRSPLRTVIVTPEYLDDRTAYPKALDATILHELGHYHDPQYVAFPFIVYGTFLATIFISPIFCIPLVDLILFMARNKNYFEDRADRWAAARMPDYYEHKDAV
jgi:beta-lactamase regulating signal transducer with metallopeptidase domain